MLTFKEYLLEATQRELEKAKSQNLQSTNKNGWKITVRPHAAPRASERADLGKTEWDDFHHTVQKHLSTGVVPDGEHVIYSKKKRQGVVVDVHNDSKKVTYITALPPGVTRTTKPGTGKHMVESIEKYNVILVD